MEQCSGEFSCYWAYYYPLTSCRIQYMSGTCAQHAAEQILANVTAQC